MGLAPLLTLGSRWTFVGGKGGVGKTTTAAALAVELADAGELVQILSTDPAHSLGDALASRLSGEPATIPEVPLLTASEVNAERERRQFIEAHQGALRDLVERGTYLEPGDVDEFLRLALPGMDELAALLQLLRLTDSPGRLIIDTAPTGHTLRLLSLPRVLGGWIDALGAMDAKHHAVAAALAGDVPDDRASRFLSGLRSDLERFSARLTDPGHTRFVLVTTPEPMVRAETYRYVDALTDIGVALGGIVVNRASDAPRERRAPRETPLAGPGARATADGLLVFVPQLAQEPCGVDGLRRFAASATKSPPLQRREGDEDHTTGGQNVAVGRAFVPPLDRGLYLIAGKGGVGKTTTASALAVLLASEAGRSVLLLSTDPAGSLGEAFGQPVGADPTPAPGVADLRLQQVDAEAAWERFRGEYREHTDRLFREMLGGVSAEADREVIARLIDLAPPGVDELMALVEVLDVTEDRVYNALVLDTAPTGHLLRLLEMPGVALDWTHTLMRLLLKYRAVVGLGDLAERLLSLSRTLRRLRDRMTDPADSWFLVVALPEALSVSETRRLVPRMQQLGMGPGALLVNRLLSPDSGRVVAGAEHARELLHIAGTTSGAGAPEWAHGPTGSDDLRRFARSWRRIYEA